MEAREIIEKIKTEDRLLSENAVMIAVQKALIEMGYEPLDNRVMGVYKAIENTPTENDLIPCSERLPRDGDFVLVTVNSPQKHEVIISIYDNKTRSFFEDGTVIAWQPLPAPYVQS